MALKKGDRFMLKSCGMEIPVVAASNATSESVEIRIGKQAFSTVNLSELEPFDSDSLKMAGFVSDVTNGHPPCPICKEPGKWQIFSAREQWIWLLGVSTFSLDAPQGIGRRAHGCCDPWAEGKRLMYSPPDWAA